MKEFWFATETKQYGSVAHEGHQGSPYINPSFLMKEFWFATETKQYGSVAQCLERRSHESKSKYFH